MLRDVDDLRTRWAKGDLVNDVRRLLQSGAEDHAGWLRENLRHALAARREDAVAVSALTGVAPGTVRGFLNGRPSSIHNVLLMAEAAGFTLAELDRPPEEFRQRLQAAADGQDDVAIGASLLAFDESPTPMAVVLLDGTIVKVNRRMRELLGYEEGELVGSQAADFSVSTGDQRTDRRNEMTATDAMRGRVTAVKRKDGSLVSVVSSAVVVRDDDGKPRYIIGRAAPVERGSDG